MVLLAIGVLFFAAVHLASAVPALKTVARERFGRRYGMVFGLASLAGLALIIAGWRLSAFVPAYQPPDGGRYAAFVMILLAFVCLGIFLFRGRMRLKLRAPLAIGTILWAVGHLFANGDWASVILFGGLLFYGAAHLIIALVTGYRPEGEARPGHDLLSILGGIALFGLMTQLHSTLFGVGIVVLQ